MLCLTCDPFARRRSALLGLVLGLGFVGRPVDAHAQADDSVVAVEHRVAALLERGDTVAAFRGLLLAVDGRRLRGDWQRALVLGRRAVDLSPAIHNQAAEGVALYILGSVFSQSGRPDSSIVYYQRSLLPVRAGDDPAGVGATLFDIGFDYHRLGRLDSAQKYLLEAVDVRRSLGDGAGQAAVLDELAHVHHDRGDRDSALVYLGRALELRRVAGAPAGLAVTLNNIGEFYNDIGQLDSAAFYLRQSLPLRREAKERRGEAVTLNNLGRLFGKLGQPDTALIYLAQALALGRAVGDRAGEATTLMNMGLIHGDIGHPDSTLIYYRQAQRLEHELRDRMKEGGTLHNIAALFSQLRYRDSALTYYRQALALRREIGDRAGQASTMTQLSAILESSGHRDSARAYVELALSLRRAVRDRDGEAVTLSRLASIHRRLGHPDSALSYYRSALVLWRAVGNRAGEADALNSIGLIFDERRKLDSALAYYSEAQGIYRAIREPTSEAATLVNLAQVHAALAHRALAIAHGKRAIVLMESYRARLASIGSEVERSYVVSKGYTYRWVANQLISAGRYAEAELVFRLLKREELQDLVRSSSPTSAEPITLSPDEKAALDLVDGHIAALTAALRCTDGASTGACGQKEATFAAARAQFELALDSVASSLDNKAKNGAAQLAFARATEAAAARWRSRLGTRAALLQTIVADSSLTVLLTLPEVRLARRHEVRRDSVRALVFRYRSALLDPARDPRPAAKALYDLLVAPFDSVLAASPISTLVWALDDALRYVPLAALYDGHRYLVERYETVVLTLAALESLGEARPKTMAVTAFGTSRAVGGFPALPAVPDELRGIVGRGSAAAGRHLAGRIVLDSAFTLTSWTTTLRRPTAVLHVASHFRFQPGDADSTFLLLGSGERFSLRALQLTGPTLTDVDVLALSACETALGAQLGDAAGAEVEAFAAIAQQKGVRSVLATLWQVNDPSIAALMQGFYRALAAGRHKGASLRAAQLALLKGTASGTPRAGQRSGAAPEGSRAPDVTPGSKWSHPYYWAPVILLGNWN